MKISMWISILVVIILIAGYAAYVWYPIQQALQKTKPLMAAAMAYEQHPANATLHILVAGDSTAYGTGASTPSESIAGLIGAEYPYADITNIGINGLKLDGLQTALQSKLETGTGEKFYDLIVLQIGANDITGFTSSAKVASELQNVLTMARAHASHVIVFTAGDVGSSPVFRFPLSTIMHYRTLMVRAIFMREIAVYQNATPDVSYVDLYTSVPASVFNSDIPKYYAADHFHPSSAGYAVWYQQVGPVVRKMLGASAGV